MAKWQFKYRIEWDATGGPDGRAGRTVWETVLERSDSICLGSGSPSGMGLDDAFQCPQEDFAGAMRVLRAPAACSVRRMSGGVAPDHYGAPRVEVELLVSTYCITGREDKQFIHT